MILSPSKLTLINIIQESKLEVEIAAFAGLFAFTIYGLVCAWLVYLARLAKGDAVVKWRVFLFSLCVCAGNTFSYELVSHTVLTVLKQYGLCSMGR